MHHYLELKNVSFRYDSIGSSSQYVLDDISMALGKTECVALVGAGGSGKTTLIQHFTGLLKPSSGQVLFQNQDIWSRRFNKAALRRKIGIVFQFPETQLFEETVEKDIAFGPRNLGVPAHEISRRVSQAMQDVNLSEDFRERSPFRLSEGEKRRAAIAGVLAMNPDMLVFDEPTAGLDPRGVRRFIDIVHRLLQNKSVVIVTHNMDFVAEVADRVIALRAGALAFDGAPRTLFQNAQLVADIGLEMPTIAQILVERRGTPDFLKGAISFPDLEQKIAENCAQFRRV